MLDADAILDQKRSPGLIENPARDVLVELAALVPADQAIVELGAFKGRSTGHLALGASRGHGARVHAFDPWEDGYMPDGYESLAKAHGEYLHSETREAFEAHMVETGAGEYVTAHQATAVEGAKAWEGPEVGLLWHDALHRPEDVAADLRAWLPHMAAEAVIVLHDAGDPRFGVEEGARRVLGRRRGWDWAGREIRLWPKRPDRRGFLIVRTR